MAAAAPPLPMEAPPERPSDRNPLVSLRRGFLVATALRLLLSRFISDTRANGATWERTKSHLGPATRLGAWLGSLALIRHLVAIKRDAAIAIAGSRAATDTAVHARAAVVGAAAGFVATMAAQDRDRSLIAAYGLARGADVLVRGVATRVQRRMRRGATREAPWWARLYRRATAVFGGGESAGAAAAMSLVAATLVQGSMYDDRCVPADFRAFSGALAGHRPAGEDARDGGDDYGGGGDGDGGGKGGEDADADAAARRAGPRMVRPTLAEMCGTDPDSPGVLAAPRSARATALAAWQFCHGAYKGVYDSFFAFNIISAALGCIGTVAAAEGGVAKVTAVGRAIGGAWLDTVRTGVFYAGYGLAAQLSQAAANAVLGDVAAPDRTDREGGLGGSGVGKRRWSQRDRRAVARAVVRGAFLCAAGPAVLLEGPGSRLGFALYVVPRALQTVVGAARVHGHRLPTPVQDAARAVALPQVAASGVGPSLAFGLGSACLFSEFGRSATVSGFSPGLAGALTWLWGPR